MSYIPGYVIQLAEDIAWLVMLATITVCCVLALAMLIRELLERATTDD